MAQRITIVGCGPGAPACVTPEACAACAGADVLVGAARALELFPECTGRRIVMHGDAQAVLEAAAALDPGLQVAVLVTGDPGIASLATLAIHRFGRAACRVVPGISSAQVAFARLGLNWTGARILSAHSARPAAAVAGEDVVAVLAGARESFGWIADVLEGCGEGYAAFVCEDLTLTSERVSRVDLAQLRRGGFSHRTVVVIAKEELIA
ncbi:MAG: precorrin-6y C5,15-methyltransferase (decarboxylating) subunit CbiE [Candidatus Methylomirabilia bacterium]